MEYNFDKFTEELAAINLQLTELQKEQFTKYYEMLIEKNKVMNLTAITEFDEVLEKHFLDSLSLVQGMGLNQNLKVLDLGTGAGFPGIPLKIMFPQLNIVLMDSLNKRIIFLNEVIEALGLENITAVHGRAEEMARDAKHREKYDLCLSRAVANLSTLSEYCLPFVRLNGSFVSYKSGEVEPEVQAAKQAFFLLGGKLDHVVKFKMGSAEMGRSLVFVKKVNGTSKTYPRKAGTPNKSPL